MRLATIQIQNFRSFEDESIVLDDYNCFVGPNGAGKSTVLLALNVFFRNTAASSADLINLTNEDFHLGNTSKPISITLTFKDLSNEAKGDLKAYVRQDQLVVSAKATWDAAVGRATVTQVGSRMVMQDFAPYFETDERGAKAEELRGVYSEIAKQYPALPKQGSMNVMKDALRAYEEAHSEQCQLVESTHQFYGWSKGENLLRKYIQWIFLPAVKDPTSEQDEGRSTALGLLLERTIRAKVTFGESIDSLKRDAVEKYQAILEEQQPVLDAVTKSLTAKVQLWTHSATRVDLRWHYNEGKSVSISEPLARIYAGEYEFLGELCRLGHGLQRSVLVALLQELAENNEAAQGRLLLGFEEPELYQHPPQARHVSSVLQNLTQKNAQVFITTHSPYFVSGRGFENIRMVRNDRTKKATTVRQLTNDQLSKSLANALGEKPRSPTATMAAIEQILQPSQSELFFANVAVVVEGIEDVAYLGTYLQLTNRWSDFRRCGCHFVVTDGKGPLSRPLAIAKGLSIPCFTIFDADTHDGDQKISHERNNKCILTLCGVKKPDPWPKETYQGDEVVMWSQSLDRAVMQAVGQTLWDDTETQVRKDLSLEGVTRKNGVLIAAVMEKLHEKNVKIDILETLADALMKFSSQHVSKEGSRNATTTS